MNLLAFFACVVCKATHGILRLLNKGATALPGTLALKICPDILKTLAQNVRVIAITGTNGKTTSARMAVKALENAGKSVFSNKSGANMPGGIAAAFIGNATPFGRPKCDWAVIECDEGYSPVLFEALRPEVVLLTNLFNDQADRYGGIMNTRDTLVRALSLSPDSLLCVNADSPVTASVAAKTANRKLYFGGDCGAKHAPDKTEIVTCPNCGAKLNYSCVTYSNLGDFRCLKCGFRRHVPDVLIKDIFDDDRMALKTGERMEIVRVALAGVYNAYNAAGVIGAVTAAGIDMEFAERAVSDFEGGFGRMESFPLGKKGARMILVKNTAAVNQTLDIIKKTREPVTAVFIQNARAGDGRDLGWLNDAEFEKLRRMSNVKKIIASGDCAEEIKTRINSAGAECTAEKDYDELVETLIGEENLIFLLPSYTAMLEIRQKLVHRLGGKDFWE